MINKKEFIKTYIMITIGTFLIACAVYFFMKPFNLSIGSISGLAIVLSNLIPFQVSLIALVLNIIFLIIGFIFIGGDFGAKTVYTTILMPLFLAIFENILPNYQSLTNDPFIDMIAYVLLVSLGLAILFLRNASSGGLDIAAKILNKYFHIEMGMAMSLAGMFTALAAALVAEPKIVIISVIGTYFNGLVVDHFIFGMNIKKKICIISKDIDKIKNYILYDLKSGASIYETIGAYSNEKHLELQVLADKYEYIKIMTYINEVDKDAFVTVYNVNEMQYKPKI